jgi:hypothetical protein
MSNQKVFELKTPFGPSSVAASKSLVAVGGEVSVSFYWANMISFHA